MLLSLAVATVHVGCGDEAKQDAGTVRTVPAPPPAQVGSLVLSGTPGAVAVGEGAVWVIDGSGGRLLQVDPAGLSRRRPAIEVGSAASAVATGAGAIWVTRGTGEVVRVDPRTREVTPLPVRVADPVGLAAGRSGVWVASRADDTVVRLDPRDGAPSGPPIPVGDGPSDVALGFGSVWVANALDGTVSRIDAGSGRVAGQPIRVAEEQILALTVGVGGVWVAATDSPQNARVEVRRIDPRSGEVDDERVPVPAGVPVGLAAGVGWVWTTDVGSSLPGTPPRPPALRRISDGDTPALAGGPIRLGGAPADVATGSGAVWVTSAQDRTLTRVVPRRASG